MSAVGAAASRLGRYAREMSSQVVVVARGAGIHARQRAAVEWRSVDAMRARDVVEGVSPGGGDEGSFEKRFFHDGKKKVLYWRAMGN